LTCYFEFSIPAEQQRIRITAVRTECTATSGFVEDEAVGEEQNERKKSWHDEVLNSACSHWQQRRLHQRWFLPDAEVPEATRPPLTPMESRL
jgi:hypothetical protein